MRTRSSGVKVVKKAMKKKVISRKLFQYSPTKMRAALRAIKVDKMKVSTACKLFNVPRTTIRHKIDGSAPEESYGCVGRHPWLQEVEDEIVDWILDVAKRGAPISKCDLLTSIRLVCDEKNIENPFTDGVPGEKWYKLFMRRHPTISLKRAEYLSKCRAQVNSSYIRMWFADVEALLGENIDIFKNPRRIFNADETAVYVCPDNGLVLGEKGKPTYRVGKRSKENLTVMICGNAAGELAPSCAVFPYDRTPTNVRNLQPPGWHYVKSKKGWMNGEVFLDYMVHKFHPWLIESKLELPVILLMDGHVSHLTLALSKFCRDNNIIIVILPPNTTHILQPLDVAFFYPLKCGWKVILKEWKQSEKFEIDVQIHHIPKVMDALLKNESFKVDLVSSFRACALFPFDVQRFPFHKLINHSEPDVHRSVEPKTNLMISHLEYLEKKIPRSVLTSFQTQYSTNAQELWNGLEFYGGLYETWRIFKEAEKNDNNDQNEENQKEISIEDKSIQNYDDIQNYDEIPIIYIPGPNISECLLEVELIEESSECAEVTLAKESTSECAEVALAKESTSECAEVTLAKESTSAEADVAVVEELTSTMPTGFERLEKGGIAIGHLVFKKLDKLYT